MKKQTPRQIRKKLGLTQEKMARICGSSVATAVAWDGGIRNPQGPSARLLEIINKITDSGEFDRYFGEYLK